MPKGVFGNKNSRKIVVLFTTQMAQKAQNQAHKM